LLAKGLVFARRNSASKCILYWIFTENNALRLLTNIRKYQRFGYYDATSHNASDFNEKLAKLGITDTQFVTETN